MASCPTANLIGCCKNAPNGYPETCYYTGFTEDAGTLTAQSVCSKVGGTWVTTP